jgi:hypothetical protein
MIFLFLLRLTWCCTYHPHLHTSQFPFIQTINTDITLLPNCINIGLARSHAVMLTSPPPLSHLRVYSLFSHTVSLFGAFRICLHHTSIFCLCSPPHHFLHAYSCCLYLSFPCMSAPLCDISLEGSLLPLISSVRTIGLPLTPLPDATNMAQLISRDQNYV